MEVETIVQTRSKIVADDDYNAAKNRNKSDKGEMQQPTQIIWKNVVLMTGLHIVSIYAMSQISQLKIFTILFGVLCYITGMVGVTAGAHRLWSHKTYKAKLSLRVILMLMNSMALQNSIFHWSRDHRSHHKHSETDADPHNAKRGFLFCHVGWLFLRKHPDVMEKGRKIATDDLMKDPVVSFQNSIIPWYFGGETLINAYCAAALRYCISLHVSWTVNSFAHMFGDRPYDKYISPAENTIVNYFALGEGHHNYHHTFPYDYAASEFGKGWSLSTMFIDFMALIGQAYDRKKVAHETLHARMKRTGKLSNNDAIDGTPLTM